MTTLKSPKCTSYDSQSETYIQTPWTHFSKSEWDKETDCEAHVPRLNPLSSEADFNTFRSTSRGLLVSFVQRQAARACGYTGEHYPATGNSKAYMAASLTSLCRFSDTGLDASRLESIYWTPCAPSLDFQLDLDLSPTDWNFEHARSREGYDPSLIDIAPALAWRCPNGSVTPTSHAVTESIASADKGPSTLPSAPPSSTLIFSPSLTTPKADPETRNQKATLCEQAILPSDTSNDCGLVTTAYCAGKSSVKLSCNTKDSCIVSDTEARNGFFTSGSNPLAHSGLRPQSFPYTPSIGRYFLHDLTKSRSCNSKTTSSSVDFTSSGSSMFWTHSKDDQPRNSGLMPFLSAALADATSSDIDADIPYSAHPSATSFISLLDADWSFDEQIVLALLSARITRYREDSEPKMKRHVPANRFAAIRLAAHRISLTRLVATLSEKTTDIAKNCFIKASRWSTAIVRS